MFRELVAATRISPNEIRCHAPARPRHDFATADVVEPVPVGVSINGNEHERTHAGLAFQYYREDEYVKPKLRFVQPRGGPTNGGTLVEIVGHRLPGC